MAVKTGLLPPRYRSPELAGRGAMGDIFTATDETLGRRVAVKVLGERYAQDASVRQRFKREALAAARLSGEPGAVTIFDVGEWQGRPFIVMEHLGGGSLEDRLRTAGAHPPERALAWLEEAAAALDAAHSHGIVHRDVKPANLLLDGHGDVHVADFGIASAAGLDSLTLTGTVLGTAGYLSPEQARGDRATSASDLYALAVVAYELLSGHRPFENDSLTAEAAAHVHAPVPSIAERQENLPPQLDAVFERALAKDPRQRFQSATEFVSALRDSFSPAAGATARLAPAPATVRVTGRGRQRLLGPALIAAGLLAAAGVGAVVAALLAGGAKQTTRVVTQRVVAPNGQTTTVHETVTRQPPAASTAAPPPPPPAVPQGDAHTLNDRGYALILRGDYQGAVTFLQQAVQRLRGTGPSDPYEAYANFNLGDTLYRLGRCSEAIPYLERAEQLEPGRHEPRQILRKALKC